MIYGPIASAGGLVQIYALNGSTPAEGLPAVLGDGNWPTAVTKPLRLGRY